MTPADIKGFIGKSVKLTTTYGTLIEGRIIAFADEPTVEIETPHGNRMTVLASRVESIIDGTCRHCGGTGVRP